MATTMAETASMVVEVVEALGFLLALPVQVEPVCLAEQDQLAQLVEQPVPQVQHQQVDQAVQKVVVPEQAVQVAYNLPTGKII
jgi:hypothetical protein